MPSDRLQQLVDALAERLQRSVVVDDPEVRLLATSRHFGDEDDVRVRAVLQRDAGSAAVAHVLGSGVATWQQAGWIPAEPGIGMHPRWCAPLRWQGELLGLLMVIDAGGATGPFRSTIAHRYLTSSLISRFTWDVDEVTGITMGVDHGLDEVRFAAPVPVHPRIRAGTEVLSPEPGGGGHQSTCRVTGEREGGDEPVAIAGTVSVIVP